MATAPDNSRHVPGRVLTDFVRAALAVPYRDGGSGWDGWDCWGLVVAAYRELLGVHLPTYTKDDARAAAEGEAASWHQVTRPQPLDVALFWPHHVGLFLSGDQFLHVMPGEGTIVSRLSARNWRARLIGIYRYAG